MCEKRGKVYDSMVFGLAAAAIVFGLLNTARNEIASRYTLDEDISGSAACAKEAAARNLEMVLRDRTLVPCAVGVVGGDEEPVAVTGRMVN